MYLKKLKKLKKLQSKYVNTYYKRLMLEDKIWVVKSRLNIIAITKKHRHIISNRVYDKLTEIYTAKLKRLEEKDSMLISKELKLFNEFESIKKDKRAYINQFKY